VSDADDDADDDDADDDDADVDTHFRAACNRLNSA
jgi:hypothetical protein